MPDTDQLLEILQADVAAVLAAAPALALANVLADNEGDIEAKVARALSTLTETGGKQGLAVVVLLPEVTEGEANLPGPPLTVKVEVRVLENVLLNRAAAKGTLLRSSQAALNVLAALHLRHLGHSLLVSGKDPVTPVEVRKGHVSHAVTLTARFSGLVSEKPGGVQASMVAGVLSLSCTDGAAAIRYTTDGSYPSPAKILYASPISGLTAGTVVRAAAYVTDQVPGDVLELTVTA